jgi:hypothetical protein
MVVSSAGAEPVPLPTTWPERLIGRSPRATWITGAALWGGSALAFSLHAYHLALPDPVRFSMLESWAIGLGCLGCPVLALRFLGKRLTPTACLFIGAIMFAFAVLLTVLTLAGEMHPDPLDATFGLILPEALGIHAVNAADVELRAARRERAAYQDGYEVGRIDALTDTLEQRYAVVAGLDRLAEMDLPRLKALADIVATHIDALGDEPRGLHLVAQPGDGRAERELPARRCGSAHDYGTPEKRGSPRERHRPQGGDIRTDPS